MTIEFHVSVLELQVEYFGSGQAFDVLDDERPGAARSKRAPVPEVAQREVPGIQVIINRAAVDMGIERSAAIPSPLPYPLESNVVPE